MPFHCHSIDKLNNTFIPFNIMCTPFSKFPLINEIFISQTNNEFIEAYPKRWKLRTRSILCYNHSLKSRVTSEIYCSESFPIQVIYSSVQEYESGSLIIWNTVQYCFDCINDLESNKYQRSFDIKDISFSREEMKFESVYLNSSIIDGIRLYASI